MTLTVLWSPRAGKKDTTADSDDNPGAVVFKVVKHMYTIRLNYNAQVMMLNMLRLLY